MLSVSRVMAMRHHPVAFLATVHLTPAADLRARLAGAPRAPGRTNGPTTMVDRRRYDGAAAGLLARQEGVAD